MLATGKATIIAVFLSGLIPSTIRIGKIHPGLPGHADYAAVFGLIP
jgi:hypothetical protein